MFSFFLFLIRNGNSLKALLLPHKGAGLFCVENPAARFLDILFEL